MHITKKEVSKLTREFLLEIVKKKHRNLDFEILFLDFEKPEVFKTKMDKYIRNNFFK
jgi:disulfide oxidoreductase YuzD